MLEENSYNRRDYVFGLAGFIAGTHALRILAEQGLASPDDIRLSLEGVRATLANLPTGMVSDDHLTNIDQMLDNLHAAAVAAEEKRNG
ncbi:MAG: hypothetical protein AVDCRST_MAG23-2693 [uncultured Sphingosinicella sp.]|uniref:Uncharacterized protein n=1 Tax=uncultured Sphingosinicella sp. TaxID=478748 RepID=A0A6J4UDQ4_9SPHN|nr:MAG: hypothetical protein AVDCRST_MAG23-2693 [uncultured Sphingosinicella sp.]